MTISQDRLDAYSRYSIAAQAANKAVSTTSEVDIEPEAIESPAFSLELSDVKFTALEEIKAVSYWRSPLDLTSHSSGAWIAHGGKLYSDVWTNNVWSAYGPDNLVDLGLSLSSPFDAIDDLRDEKEQIKRIISFVRRSLNVPYANRLARRLTELLRISEEEAPYQSALSSDSLRMFIRFFQLPPDVVYPGVTLTPRGYLRARWRAAPNKLCAAEFFPDGAVHFAVFAPNRIRPTQTIRLSGIDSVETFLSTVEPHGVLEWMQP